MSLVRHPFHRQEGFHDRYCLVSNLDPTVIWVQVSETSDIGIYVCPAADGDRVGTQVTVHARRDMWGSTFHTDSQHTGVFSQWLEEKPLCDDYKEVITREHKPRNKKLGKVIMFPSRPPME